MKYQSAIRLHFTLVLLGLLSACNWQNKSNQKPTLLEFNNRQLLEFAQNGVLEKDLRVFRLALLRLTEKASAVDTVKLIINAIRENSEQTYYHIWIAESIESALLFEQGRAKEGLEIVKKSLTYMNKHDSILSSDVFHNLGYAYMNVGGYDDSVLYYWRKAYQITEKSGDLKRLTVTSFNLAAHYHNLGLYDMARRLFGRTIQAMEQLGKKSPLLMNNIVSTMIAREKYSEAEIYWNEHRAELIGDTNTYAGQVILLNRAVLSQRIKRYKETDSILNLLSHVQIQPLLWRDYTQALVLQSLRLRLDTLTDRRFEKQVVLHLDFLIHNNEGSMLSFMGQRRWQFLRDSIPKLYDRYRIQPGYSQRYLASLSKFLALSNQSTNPAKSLFYFNQMLGFQDSVRQIQFKTDLLATNELSEYESVMSQLALNQVALEDSKRREGNYVIILILVLLLVAVSFFSFKEKLQLSKIRTEFLEKEKLQAEELVLSNQRLITYSKVVLERDNQIKQRLMKLNLRGKSELVKEVKEIIKEIDTLNRVNTKEKPQIADDLIVKRPEEEHPHLSKLSKVEQRVYVLVQSNYRPKDIANMLGYSVQYVRNIKTRIGKKLSLDDSWN